MRTLLSPGGVEVNASDENAKRLIACGFTEQPEDSKQAAKPKAARKAPAKTTTKRKA